MVKESVNIASATKESFDSLLLSIEQLNASIVEITQATNEVRNNSGYILERAEISAISEKQQQLLKPVLLP